MKTSINRAFNVLIVVATYLLTLSCNMPESGTKMQVKHVVRSSGLLSSSVCAEFNANKYKFKGANVYVAPDLYGYMIIYDDVPNDDGIFEFVSSNL